jgi:PAS domain S-box-containing protein
LSDFATAEDPSELKKSPDRSSNYDQLKSWYLARLRKQALALHDKNLTPAGLIRADRDLIEGLVLGAAAPGAAGEIAAQTMGPVALLAAVYGAVMLVLFICLLNAENGSFFEATRHFFQLVLGTLVLQGGNHELFAKVAGLTYILPAATYGLPCLMAVVLEPLGASLSSANRKEAGMPASWLPHGALTIILALILSLIPALVLSVLEAGSPASDPVWRIVPCLSAWGLIVLTALSSHHNFALLFPLRALLGTLKTVTRKTIKSKTYAGALQELVQELTQTRDELASRETLIADASPDLLLVLAADERILCCNWTSQNLLGFLPEELRSRNLAELVLPQDLEAARATFSAAQESKQAGSFDCRLQTKQRTAADTRCTVEFSATHNCFFVSAHDVSDQKTLERARREFVSMLGHDIRIPLSAALLTAQALKASVYGELPAAAGNMLGEVELSLKRLVKLLEELLEFEQLSAGKMRLEIFPCNTDDLIGQALSELSGQAKKKKITVAAAGEGVNIDGDAGKLLRVIVNLVSNAIKFSPADSKITVTTQRPRSGSVEIRVSDQGPGIPSEYQKIVFERYERLESTSQEQGRGLGLAIAKAIVESHGGMIGVESETGRGSTFWLTLPMRSPKMQTTALPAQPEKKGTAP